MITLWIQYTSISKQVVYKSSTNCPISTMSSLSVSKLKNWQSKTNYEFLSLLAEYQADRDVTVKFELFLALTQAF